MASRMDPGRARYRRRVVAYLDEAIPEERALWEFIDGMPNGRVRQAALREMLLSGQRAMLTASTIKAMVRQARAKVAHLRPTAGDPAEAAAPQVGSPLPLGHGEGYAAAIRTPLPPPQTTPLSVNPRPAVPAAPAAPAVPASLAPGGESQEMTPPSGARRRLMW